MKYNKLIFVDSDVNHNKFYEMKDNEDGTFTATWGRVGATGQTAQYSMNQWDKKFKEKTKKGYKDVTENVVEAVIATPSGNTNIITSIKDPHVKTLIDTLKRYSKETISNNYNIEVRQVTEKAVNTAQGLIDEIFGLIYKDSDITKINNLLIELFTVIPRKIKKVKDNLIQNELDNDNIIQEWKNELGKEQALLDVMRSEVEMAKQHATNIENHKSVDELEELGLEAQPVTKDEEDMLKKLMTDSSNRFIKAFKVINKRTQLNFDKFVAKSDNKSTKLLFHGSRSENWLSIITTGLVLRPTNAVITGKLFGHGIYFANNADKSLGYIDGGRWNNSSSKQTWLAVYDVHMGNAWVLQNRDFISNIHNKMDDKKILQYKDNNNNNYDCVWAKSGLNYGGSPLRKDEIIIYNELQCTIKYLIEVR